MCFKNSDTLLVCVLYVVDLSGRIQALEGAAISVYYSWIIYT